MVIEKSTVEQLAVCDALVRGLEAEMQTLVAAGKKIHLIWDVDGVLVSSRSDDAFGILGFDVSKYFTYEERLIAEKLEDGPWARVARRCGELQQSQDIVTARSSFLAMRVMLWCLDYHMPMRWQLFVGHQPKSESYRIILASFKDKPDTHVLMVDDGKKHVDAFNSIVAELGMTDRCCGVLAPSIRNYDEAEIRREVDGVMGMTGDSPQIIEARSKSPGVYGRYVLAVPDPRATIRSMFMGLRSSDVFKAAIVDRHREVLLSAADELMPGKPKTVENLYFLFELLGEPGGGR